MVRVTGHLDPKVLKERQKHKEDLKQKKIDEKRCLQVKRDAFTPIIGTCLGDLMPDRLKAMVKRTVNGPKKESKKSRAQRKARGTRPRSQR